MATKSSRKKKNDSTELVIKELGAVTLPRELAEAQVTPKTLKAYQEKLLAFTAPQILAPLFEQLRLGVSRGDMDMMEMAAKIFSLVGNGNGGFSITNNIIQNNTNQGSGPAWSFDAAARRGAEKRTAAREAAAAEIIDVEPVPAAGA